MIRKWCAALLGAVVTAMALMAAPAMAIEYSAPYPRLSVSEIEPCRGQFTIIKGQTANYYRRMAKAYAPGGELYAPVYANGNNTRTYNALADQIDAEDAVAWWVKGFFDDGMGFGGLDSIYNTNGDSIQMIAKGAKGLDYDGNPIQPFTLTHEVGNLYSYADGNPAGTCVDRIYMAKYEALHANDTAQAPATGDCFASADAALACYNRRVEEIKAKHPAPGTAAGARATYQYMYALGNAAMDALETYKTALGDKYRPEHAALVGVIDSSFKGCNQLSSSNAECPNVFP